MSLVNIMQGKTTRWVEKVTGLSDFEDFFMPVVKCLDVMSLSICRNCNYEKTSTALNYYKDQQ